MENLTAVGSVEITFYNKAEAKLGSESMEFTYFNNENIEIRVPKKTTSIIVTFNIDIDDMPIPSGIVKIKFLDAKRKPLGSRFLESFDCSDECEDFEVPLKTKFVKVYCSLF